LKRNSQIAENGPIGSDERRTGRPRLHVARRIRGGHDAEEPHGLDATAAPPPVVYGVRGRQLQARPAAPRSQWSRPRRTLFLGDVFALTAGFFASALVGAPDSAGTLAMLAALMTSVIAGVSLAAVYGLYSRDEQRSDHSTADDVPGALHVTLIVTWLAAAARWAAGARVHPPAMFAQLLSSLLLLVVLRAAVRSLHRRRGRYAQNTIVVGAGSVGQLLAGKLISRPVHGLRLIGFVDDEPPEIDGPLAHVPLLGEVAQLQQLIERFDIERVIVAFSRHSHEQTLGLVRALKGVDVQVDVVPRLFDVFGPSAGIHAIDGLPLMAHPRKRPSRAERCVKRAIDIALSSAGMIVLAPAFIMISVLVRLDSRGRAIYRAERVGRGGRTFKQLKFRSMYAAFCHGSDYGGEEAEAAFERLLADNAALREQHERSHKLDPDPRVTRVGRFLRVTSLDELPQLFNVLRGDLSLVGPRPVTIAELARYGENVPQLLSVRPGMTGYWQINGRSALGYDERVRLDLAYVSNWSLKLDLQILVKTTTQLTARGGAV
jgi:exopolysaccharide biosynthesis polyprenyl glycosylphosphotransferase